MAQARSLLQADYPSRLHSGAITHITHRLEQTLFFLQVKGACQAPRPIGPPTFRRAFGGNSTRTRRLQLHKISLTLSLSVSVKRQQARWGTQAAVSTNTALSLQDYVFTLDSLYQAYQLQPVQSDFLLTESWRLPEDMHCTSLPPTSQTQNLQSDLKHRSSQDNFGQASQIKPSSLRGECCTNTRFSPFSVELHTFWQQHQPIRKHAPADNTCVGADSFRDNLPTKNSKWRLKKGLNPSGNCSQGFLSGPGQNHGSSAPGHAHDTVKHNRPPTARLSSTVKVSDASIHRNIHPSHRKTLQG